MYKKILGGVAVAAFAAIVGMNVKMSNSQDSKMSDLNLANVEALASEGSDCPNGCYANGKGCWCYQWYACEREAR